MAMSSEETKTKAAKKKAPMAHSNMTPLPSNPDEALGGMMKKKAPMAHSGPMSTSNKDEALGGMMKKKATMV
jgi:hypothetical protein